jgi:hypothetical protein
MKYIWLCFLALFVAGTALAEDFRRYPVRHSSDRVNVYLHDGDSQSSYRSGPTFTPSSDSNSCFPAGCGSIEGPFTNPNPDARKPENLPSCMYDATGTLFYERENKACPYKYIDANQVRVEARRQEWLRQQRK